MSVGKHHSDQLLEAVFHYMGQDLRGRLMTECPAAYNAYVGREVVKVVRTSDDTPIEPDKPAPVVYLNFAHPDELVRCKRCKRIWLEHDPFDRACPDDDDHARLNLQVNEPA